MKAMERKMVVLVTQHLDLSTGPQSEPQTLVDPLMESSAFQRILWRRHRVDDPIEAVSSERSEWRRNHPAWKDAFDCFPVSAAIHDDEAFLFGNITRGERYAVHVDHFTIDRMVVTSFQQRSLNEGVKRGWDGEQRIGVGLTHDRAGHA